MPWGRYTCILSSLRLSAGDRRVRGSRRSTHPSFLCLSVPLVGGNDSLFTRFYDSVPSPLTSTPVDHNNQSGRVVCLLPM